MHRWKIYHPRSTDPERREPLAFKSSNRVSLTFSLTIFSIRNVLGAPLSTHAMGVKRESEDLATPAIGTQVRCPLRSFSAHAMPPTPAGA